MTVKPGAAALIYFDCPECLALPGMRCVDDLGNEVLIHPLRRARGEGWLSRTLEVAGLRAARAQAEAEVVAAAADLATRDVRISQLELANAELQRQVDELTRPQPRTLFGSCPPKPGGATLAAQQRVTDKWGKGAAVRAFINVGVKTPAPRHPDAGVLHVSWKEFSAANLTEASVAAAVRALLPGDVVEIDHESNNDPLSVQGVADRIALKNLFYDLVKKVRPDLLVAHTMTGWAFEPKSNLNPFVWAGKVKADILGMDCDGIRPTALPYTNYEDETRKILAIVNDPANHYSLFAVPEFGCPRIPTLDPDGVVRAAYHDFYAGLWKSSGKCAYVTLYEFDSSPNYSLTTEAEITGWKKHV